MVTAEISSKFNIPVRNKKIQKHTKKVSHQTVLSNIEEKAIISYCLTCAEYGMSMYAVDVQMIDKSYLLEGPCPQESYRNV